ncbi:MAG: hypothetical protein FWF28_04140 [Micrococcales bacterium]|nr:hypothetical protein [Micrococcales bacterium]
MQSDDDSPDDEPTAGAIENVDEAGGLPGHGTMTTRACLVCCPGGERGMTSPQDRPPAWAAPGGSAQRPDEQPGPTPAAPPPTAPPPASLTPGTVPPAAPPPGAVPPPAAPGAWGVPQLPPAWTGQSYPGGGAVPPGYGPTPPPGYGPTPPGYQGPGAPGYGPTPPPGYPGYGYPPVPPGWRPPALQPGIIPLRPLSLGEILDGGVRAIRANPAVMFGLSAVVVTIGVIASDLLASYLSGLLAGPLNDFFGSLPADGSAAFPSDFVGQMTTSVGTLLAVPVTSLITTILTGLLVVAVSRSVLGRAISVREVLHSGRVWWVLGFTLLSMLAVLAVGAILVGIVVVLATSHQVGFAVLVAILGLLGYAVAAVWFNTRTLLVTPALMLEGKGFWATVARAWRLTRGSFWRLFGIWLLAAVIMGFISGVIAVPFTLIAGLVASGLGATVITSIGNIISMTAATTYTSAVLALLYIDVRMRREGLDIELGRAATADAAGAVR